MHQYLMPGFLQCVLIIGNANLQWQLPFASSEVLSSSADLKSVQTSFSSTVQICHAREPSCISSTEREVRSECVAFQWHFANQCGNERFYFWKSIGVYFIFLQITKMKYLMETRIYLFIEM